MEIILGASYFVVYIAIGYLFCIAKIRERGYSSEIDKVFIIVFWPFAFVARVIYTIFVLVWKL